MTDDTTLESRLARLEAINDISRLSADYCRGADRRDLELFLSVWAPEGTWHVRPALSFTGLSQIEQGIRTQWGAVQRAFHWTSNARIDVSGDSATATYDVDSESQLLDGSWLAIAGAYNDELVRLDGRWLILTRSAEIFSQRVTTQG